MKLIRLDIFFFLVLLDWRSVHSFVPSSPLFSAQIQKNGLALQASLSEKENNSPSTGSVGESKHTSPIDVLKSGFQKHQAFLGSVMTGAMLCAGCLSADFVSPPPAVADGSRVVGQLQGSGLVFKDTLLVESFDDPKVRGVTLYISNFQRPLTERMTSNFFSDPSYASVSCAKTGPVSVASNIGTGPQGEQVFEESRSLLFKSLRVQRIYDPQKNTVVYVSYNTRIDKNDDSNKSRFKSSLCAVNLDDSGAAGSVATSPRD